MKIELVINDSMRIPVGYEMLESVLGHIEPGGESLPLLEALAEHPAKEVRVALAQKDNLSQASFRKLFATRDFAVIEALLNNSGNGSYFSKEMLTGLISQSEFARAVASSLDDFPHADDDIAEALAKHLDPYVRNALAGNYSAPKKLLKLLVKDEDPSVAKSAKQTME